MTKKNTIRLTESELNYIIKESVKKIVTENIDEENFYEHLIGILKKDKKVEVSPRFLKDFISYARTRGIYPEIGARNGENTFLYIDSSEIIGQDYTELFNQFIERLSEKGQCRVPEELVPQFKNYAMSKGLNPQGAGTLNGKRTFYV